MVAQNATENATDDQTCVNPLPPPLNQAHTRCAAPSVVVTGQIISSVEDYPQHMFNVATGECVAETSSG